MVKVRVRSRSRGRVEGARLHRLEIGRKELLDRGARRALEVLMVGGHQRAQQPGLQPRVPPVRRHEDEPRARVGKDRLQAHRARVREQQRRVVARCERAARGGVGLLVRVRVRVRVGVRVRVRVRLE